MNKELIIHDQKTLDEVLETILNVNTDAKDRKLEAEIILVEAPKQNPSNPFAPKSENTTEMLRNLIPTDVQN